MPVYLVTGKLGAGKTLAMVDRIKDYLKQKRVVATNLDLNLEKLCNPMNKTAKVYRLPDKPTVDDLNNLPAPYEGDYDEEKTGAIVLDECGTWFNTRGFQDKSRQPLINKLLHIRKAGWDVFFIIQHIDMIDKQVREGLGEHVVTCQRLDRLGLPFITGLGNLFGMKIRPPRIHMALVKYGTGQYAPLVDRWVYRGTELYDAYDTRQVFGSNDCQLSEYLTPYMHTGRHTNIRELRDAKNKETVKTLKRFTFESSIFFLIIGLFIGNVYSFVTKTPGHDTQKISQEKTSENKDIKNTEKTENSLETIRITASVRVNSSYEYYFWDESKNKIFEFGNDYLIRAIDDCTAKIISLNTTHIITCHTKAFYSDVVTREGGGNQNQKALN